MRQMFGSLPAAALTHITSERLAHFVFCRKASDHLLHVSNEEIMRGIMF